MSTIEQLHKEAQAAAAKAVNAEAKALAAQRAEEERQAQRAAEWDRATVENYDDKVLEAAEDAAEKRFIEAVRRGEAGIGDHLQGRVLRRIRLNRAAEVNSAAMRLGVASPAVRALGSGTELYATALQQALNSIAANTAEDDNDVRFERRDAYAQGDESLTPGSETYLVKIDEG